MSTDRTRPRLPFRSASPRSRVGLPWGLLAFALLFATATPASLGAQARTLTVDDLRLEVGLSGPELAPDGRRAVVVTSRPDYEENRFGRSLVVVDLATDERRDLTPQRPWVGQPRWSPSGDALAFTDRVARRAPRCSSFP
jgi:hypothetical protein